ncbi:GntR family transcriptional regulator [Allopusillimonas ginsengisoli]|uniref:GntR family transcriptional regulator n=1 Tax=Allopusillimonas ginsengisoli TaxID=453575 RepID=UPI0010C15E5E|nr:GntR family transcriptional regulator [Allopusillimonas ginsengisoli]
MTTPEKTPVFKSLWSANHSGIPKYRLVVDAITRGISEGYWKAGDKLPTEEELVEEIPFSLGTVQRALRLLVDQGIVIRQHGLGTFVAQSHLQLDEPWHCRFIADDGQSFLPVYANIISRNQAEDDGEWKAYFTFLPQDIIEIRRVVKISDEFNVFTRFYFDRAHFPSLWNTPIEHLNGLNFKKQIVHELKLPIVRTEQLLRIVPFDEEVAGYTNVKPHSTGLCLTASAYTGFDKCVYFQRFFIPPTTRSLSVPGTIQR